MLGRLTNQTYLGVHLDIYRRPPVPGYPDTEVIVMVSARGGRYGFVYRSRWDVYRALRRHGMTKKRAAQISNAGRTALARESGSG